MYLCVINKKTMKVSEETLKAFEELKAKRYSLQLELGIINNKIEKLTAELKELVSERYQILSEL